jgi:hypothetical protein
MSTQQRLEVDGRMPRLQLVLEREQAVPMAVIEHKRLRPVRRDLRAQLGADGVPRAGHQHSAPGQELANAGQVEPHRLEPEEVVHLHLAHLREHDAAACSSLA